MALIIILITITLAFITRYLWIWSYWIRKGVPGPRGRPFFGVLDVLLEHEKPGVLQLAEWTKVGYCRYAIARNMCCFGGN